MKTTRVHGIYKITNTINSKFYIGSAANLSNRFSCHKRDLKKNQHHNSHLQAAWNKYGGDAFTFEVLEVVPIKTDLVSREQFYLDTLNPTDNKIGYNVSKCATSSVGCTASPETRLRQSISAKNKFLKYPPLRGEEHPDAKLTWAIVDDIRARYASGENNQEELAEIAGVCRRYVGHILAGNAWIKEDTRPIIKPDTVTNSMKELIIDLIKSGRSRRSVVKETNVPDGKVRGILRNAGLMPKIIRKKKINVDS